MNRAEHTGPRRCRYGLIADEEVEVLSSTLGRKVSRWTSTAGKEGRLVGDGRTTRARTARATCRALGRDRSWEYKGGGVVAGKT